MVQPLPPQPQLYTTGLPLRVRPSQFPTLAAGATLQVYSRQARLYGWAILEATGSAAAEVVIYDGFDANGPILADITLAADQSTRDYFGYSGLWADAGIFVKCVSGSVRGTVWIAEQ